MSTQRSGRLGVGIIGAGLVGPVLGAALAGAGHALTGISAISAPSRERAAAILPGVPVLEVPRVIERSELVLLAVPERELRGLVEGLAATGAWQPGQLVVHTAPGYGIRVLAPATAAGAIPLAIHPAMTFTGTSLDLTRLAEAWFAVTAPAPVQPIGQALVVEMGGEPILVGEADRPAYAEAVATVSAFSPAIIEQAVRLLAGIGIESPGSVLGPLARTSLEDALSRASAASIDLADLPSVGDLEEEP
ncbi:MAG: hypothetical protein JWR57_1237 [Mycetocola sp.]|nr:hypothetical protein [Mycetocola sp.]